jgi:energy-coupling factor transporter ATP-binding protein EcfA2
MKLTRFQIQMYKCILDSGWVEVQPLTVVVGKNEAGKTALLRALHKLNPFTSDPYSIPNEWPRGLRDKRSDKQVVCTAEFALDPEEQTALAAITDQNMNIGIIKVSKNYAGEFEVLFPEGVFPDRLHPNDIDSLCSALPQIQNPVDAGFQEAASACGDELLRLAREGRFEAMASFPEEAHKRLQGARNQTGQQPQYQNEEAFMHQFRGALTSVTMKLKDAPSIRMKAHDYVVSRLPTFVYMDEYRAFTGTALLDQVKQRKDRHQLSDEDTTLLTIFALAGLDLDMQVRAAGESNREQRQYDLSDAAATLTQKVAPHWGAQGYEVDFRADGQQFFTFVKAPGDKALIKLEERSRGFQWFFSFDLMLMHETKGTFKGCVILLDEPGLHLHPGAQRDLLARLSDYAEGNTLIYTTHLPFMIDVQEPGRIRVLAGTPQNVVVDDDLTKSEPEAKLTLQAALGISGRSSYLVARHNLVVEGVHDYWLVVELSNLLIRSGQAGLPADLMVTAAGGANEATYIATFMVGQELEVAVLYDTDREGDAAKEKFVKRWLARYKSTHAQALSLGTAVGSAECEFAIEDIFPQDFYAKFVMQVYGKQLAAAGAEKPELPRGAQLCKRWEAYFDKLNLKFNKGSVAKRICAAIRMMKGASELPPDALRRSRALITAIADAIPMSED